MPNLQDLFQPLMDAILDAYEGQRGLYASTFGQEDAAQQIQRADANGKRLARWREDLQLIFSEMEESELFGKTNRTSKESKLPFTYITPSSNLKMITGKKPIEVVLFGKLHQVNTWKKILVCVLEDLYALHPKEVSTFEHNTILNKRRLNFSKIQTKISIDPVYSNKTGFYVETNHNAITIIRLCEKMLNICGYQGDELKIAIKQEGA